MPESRNDLFDRERMERGIRAMVRAAESEGLTLIETAEAAGAVQRAAVSRMGFKYSVMRGVEAGLGLVR